MFAPFYNRDCDRAWVEQQRDLAGSKTAIALSGLAWMGHYWLAAAEIMLEEYGN